MTRLALAVALVLVPMMALALTGCAPPGNHYEVGSFVPTPNPPTVAQRLAILRQQDANAQPQPTQPAPNPCYDCSGPPPIIMDSQGHSWDSFWNGQYWTVSPTSSD
jgi:hypothetical protein